MASVLIIPAYNPDQALLELLNQHQQSTPEQPVIIVNDGSQTSCLEIFNLLSDQGCHVLHHKRNQGKGAALKTAFQYYLQNFSGFQGVVTADADGQHHIQDIARLSQALETDTSKLHLGVRSFNDKKIPFRSRFGNILTKFIVNRFFNAPLIDTQSGLRAIPNELINALMLSQKDRYEFELEMFFIAKQMNFDINQIPIQTIYMNNNQSSHFRPVIDSMRIYAIFFRYGSVAMLSFLFDFTLFCLLINLTGQLAFSVLAARLCSATFNFMANKTLTFKSQKSLTRSAIKYGLLAGFSGILVWQLTAILHGLHLNLYISKLSADVILFFTNFTLQKYWVFSERENKQTA